MEQTCKRRDREEAKLFVESPWYGVLEIVDEPGAHPYFWGTSCWNGKETSTYVTSTLQPLTPEAALMLGVPWGTKVWDEEKKQKWSRAGICADIGATLGMGETVMLFAICTTEDGISIEKIDNWEKWVAEKTEGIRDDCQPQFKEWPAGESYLNMEDFGRDNLYLIIKGDVVVPKPVQVVTKYEKP